MLPKKYKLPRNDFKKILNKGKVFHTESFVLSFIIKSEIQGPQIGVIASLKVSKLATARNRAKRALKAAILNKVDDIRSEAQIILIAKKRILEKEYKSVEEDLMTTLERAKLLK